MWVRHQSVINSTGGWFGILGGHEKDCVLFMSRLKIVSGLPYKIVIESWNTHASSSSQETLLWKAVAWGSREKRERSQSVPLTLPASYSLIDVHQNRWVWTVSTLSLSSFPAHVLSVRKRLYIFCIQPKFHNLPLRGNIISFSGLYTK